MMTRFLFLLLIIFFSINKVTGQTISGQVTDKKGSPLPGANIFIKGSFDGATSDAKGFFSFKTEESGFNTIVVSFIGFTTQELQVNIEKSSLQVDFSLAEIINKLDGVTITAGAFEASDEKKGVVLKSLDIAMTAGATADIAGAINTLPGTQTVGESGRLFVRGGESHETKVFVDGLQVNNFFGISAPNTAARGRFSPFLFKGTTFSTGGYSAEYGQALSSTLLLNSNDLPEEDRTDINIMSMGLGAAKTKIWNNTSLTAELNYMNLNPYIHLVKQDIDWQKAPESAEASFVFRQRTRQRGLLKLYGNFNMSGLEMNQYNLNEPGTKDHIKINNDFYYLNASYRDVLNNKWSVSGGSSVGLTRNKLLMNLSKIYDEEVNIHSKAVLTNDLNEKITLRMGVELFNDVYNQSFRESSKNQTLESGYTENLVVAFAETDVYLSNRFVFRGGARAERSALLNKSNIAPRVSLAYKTGEKGQVSIAYGEFFQTPQKQFLTITHQLEYSQATHYILNYQRIHDDRIFRIEGYRKEYNNLIKFDFHLPNERSNLNNLGTGYANGIDVFIRDRKSIKNGDFWISYSLLDSKRDHQDFPGLSKVSFFSTHNFSFVYKHFINSLRTQIGATYNFSSPRPYHDPNKEGFMNSSTKPFNDLSFNAAFLYKPNIVLYVSATNIMGFKNVFGYRFSEQPNADGVYAKEAIGLPAPRFLFLGLFITLTKNKQANQLENLN